MKQVKRRMCVINPALMADIAPIVGGQADIMCKIGISWNSWTKISNGLPIRYSMAERLRARIVSSAESIEGLRARFPSTCGGINHAALNAAFFMDDAPDVLAGGAGVTEEDGAAVCCVREPRWNSDMDREVVAQH